MLEFAFVVLCFTLLLREIMHQHEQKRWHIERKDLYNRIQAGTFQEYVVNTREPSAPVQKDREQLVSEEAHQKGIRREDLQYPAHWKV